MNKFLLFILFFGLITHIFSQIPVWDFKESAIDLLSNNSIFYEYVLFENKQENFKLIKEINKTNEEINQKNYVQLSENKIITNWEGIQEIYNEHQKIYVCPSGKNYLSYYSGDKFEELNHSEKNGSSHWDLTCYYLNENKDIFLLSYLNSEDNNIYGYKLSDYSWFKIQMHEGYLDIIWPNKLENYEIFHIFLIIIKEECITLGKMEVTIRDQPTGNIVNSAKIVERLKESFAFFDENKNFYWITYNETFFLSGYSEEPLDNISKNPDQIKVTKNNYSPFEFIENVTINYVNFIRNTKYAFYEIKANEKIYHGIIDIKLNKIIFNTDELIKDFKPYSKDSLLVITNKSAYKICVFAQVNDTCINECPEGQKLILSPEKNNYCGEKKECENYILMPMDICVNECDNTFYVIQNQNECGLCKNMNQSYPYKIISEKECRKEKPNNTYFYDKNYYLLDYCDSSCETCYGKKDDQCLSCKEGTLINGKCYKDKCPDGYYKDINGTCENCDSNCLTCDAKPDNGNNHCTSCNATSNQSLLIVAKGFNQNCVDKCPEQTKLNNDNKTCILENENNESNGNGKGNNEGKGDYLLWIIIIIVILLLIIILLILVKRCFSTKKANSQSTENIDSQFNKNGSPLIES